jgi:hypothetical protein
MSFRKAARNSAAPISINMYWVTNPDLNHAQLLCDIMTMRQQGIKEGYTLDVITSLRNQLIPEISKALRLEHSLLSQHTSTETLEGFATAYIAHCNTQLTENGHNQQVAITSPEHHVFPFIDGSYLVICQLIDPTGQEPAQTSIVPLPPELAAIIEHQHTKSAQTSLQ